MLMYSAGAEFSVFSALKDRNGSQIFPMVSQNAVQTRFTATIKVHQNLPPIISVFR